MNKPLLISLAAAAILGSNAQALTMEERFDAMEAELNQLKSELTAIKAAPEDDEPEEESEEIAAADESDDEETDDEDEDDSDEEEEEEEEEEEPLPELTLDETIEELVCLQEDIDALNRATGGNHLKLGVDFRTSYDNIQYTMADGSKQKNDALLTNRLWINMNWAYNDNISFTGQLAYNKAYGARSSGQNYPFGDAFEDFDWIVNENPYDDSIRVRTAYFFYRNNTFLGTNVPWTFSVGRRSSTNGHLINLRENDPANSPMGHAINVEFDGLSAKFSFDKLTGIDGMYVKFCAGRGLSNAEVKFSSAPYATSEESIPDIDLGGLIFVPYNDGQYALNTQYYYAANLIDANLGTDPMAPQFMGMETVGNMSSFTTNFIVNGIGNEWSEYLDDTVFFLSGAWSVTDPDAGKSMLGSAESETGYSYWVGLQTPSLFTEDGRWGFEYNHGSEYWRSITYAEDTMIGSKIAARGNAYEAYFTEPLIDDVFSLQLRYTYIDYDYTGSNGFFGSTTGASMKISDIANTPMAAQVVDKAQDFRAYLRYRY